MLYYSFKICGKKAWIFIACSVLTFAFTDSVTSAILKPLFDRLRPCCDPDLQWMIRKLVECGGIYSFPSSHAANHFGLAAFWYWSIKSITGKKWNWLWWWAGIICYAQVYVGKHYPFDILTGALLGYFSGVAASRLFFYGFSLIQKPRDIFYSSVRGSTDIS